jgi:curli biogenesis system outer membrane secretion channel CsgG
MKKGLKILACLLLSCALIGCASFGKKGVSGKAAYSGKKARVALADFTLEAQNMNTEAGQALRERLTDALNNTGRFQLFDYPELQNALQQKKREAVIVAITVTKFEAQASGGRDGIAGGGGAKNSAFGGWLGPSLNKASLALDIRILDAGTSKVLVLGHIQAQAADSQKAIRICATESARYLTRAVPGSYYKY